MFRKKDLRPMWVVSIVVVAVPVILKWVYTLMSLFPGVPAVGRHLKLWWRSWYSAVDTDPPLQGLDESADGMLQEIKLLRAEAATQAAAQTELLERMAQGSDVAAKSKEG
jgi:hypothetical protein